MSDFIVSVLRTAVPVAWGSLIAWLLGAVAWLPGLLTAVGVDPTSDAAVGFVTSLVIVGWYALWRKVEPLIPAWLVTLVLGAAKAPTYSTPPVLSPAERYADADALIHDPTPGVVDDPAPYIQPHGR